MIAHIDGDLHYIDRRIDIYGTVTTHLYAAHELPEDWQEMLARLRQSGYDPKDFEIGRFDEVQGRQALLTR
jgi:hypothetical protein